MSLGSLAACVVLAGCGTPQTYRSTPIDPGAYPAARALRRLPERAQWTEADLLQIAIDNDTAVREAVAGLRAATAEAEASKVRAPVTLTLTGEYANEAGTSSPWLAGAAGAFPLDRKTARLARLTLADLPPIQARYRIAEAVWEVRGQVRRALIELEFASRAVALTQERGRIAGQIQAVAEARAGAGEDGTTARLAAATQTAGLALDAAAANGRLRAATTALAVALGTAPGEAASITTAPGNSGDVQAIAIDPGSDQAARLRLSAALNQTRVLQALVEYDLAEARLKAEVARQFPNLVVEPGYTWERGLSRLPVSLALALPPADRNRSAISAAEAARVQAATAVEAAQASAINRLDEAVQALGSAIIAWTAAEANGRSAQAQRQDAALRLAAGEAGALESLEAQSLVLAADLQTSEALRQVRLARAAVEDCAGAPLEPQDKAAFQTLLQSLGAR